ncbi:hypothetical protein [Sinomicrobium soli]|nr:hypothetical protein [Sinomicrobium sp. N-1-3-6]
MSSSASCTCCDTGYRERSGSFTLTIKKFMETTRDKISVLHPQFLVFSK